MKKFDANPNDDLTGIIIQIDGKSFTADAAQLDAIIESLINIRTQLQPAIPKQPVSGKLVKMIVDPIYLTKLDPETGMTLLAMRHPGQGWLYFMFPEKERDHLAELLFNQAKEQSITDATRPPKAIH